MSNLSIPESSRDEHVPKSKIGKQFTGDDYRESLLTSAKLEKALGNRAGIIPMRPRVFRIADSLIEKLNILEAKAENDPLSTEAMQLAQLKNVFGFDNVIDIAMVLANSQILKEQKNEMKKLTGVTKDSKTDPIINLDDIAKNVPEYLTKRINKDTKDLVEIESKGKVSTK